MPDRLWVGYHDGRLPYQAGRLAHACGVRTEITVTAGDVRRAFTQLYFDTITHDVTALRFLVDRAGVDHVLLGTDLPFDMATQEPAGELAAALGDGAEAIAQVGSGNAAGLFGLDGAHDAAAGTARAPSAGTTPATGP